MSEFEGLVWIVERDHEPLIVAGRVVSFPSGGEETNKLRRYLDSCRSQDKKSYYDGVLYERRSKKFTEDHV